MESKKNRLQKKLQSLQNAYSVKEISKISKGLPQSIKELTDHNVSEDFLTRTITTVSDTVTKKAVKYVIEKLGPPPCEFAFIAMGSEGRREQTLATDQDNAVIYEDVPVKLKSAAQKYFLHLGKKVCSFLDKAGYCYCKGRIMAKNPKWCQPISAWKRYFSNWIDIPNPQELRKINIFFDFRHICGNKGLTDKLRRHISKSVRGKSVFFLHLAENAMLNKPPVNFLGNFKVFHKAGHHNTLNIKQAMGIVVDFARIYALRNNIHSTNTIDRINRIFKMNILEKPEYEKILKAYTRLMHIRFKHQAIMLKQNLCPDNYIDPKKLTDREKSLLKNAFMQISAISSKIRFLIQFGLVD